MSSEARTHDAWHSKPARQLLRTYYKAKKRVMERGGKPLTTAEEWAGSLLVVTGSAALAKFEEGVRMGIPFPKPNKIRRLLTEAINAELELEHGIVGCVVCEESGVPTIDWRTKPLDDGSLLFRCPKCSRTLKEKPN